MENRPSANPLLACSRLTELLCRSLSQKQFTGLFLFGRVPSAHSRFLDYSAIQLLHFALKFCPTSPLNQSFGCYGFRFASPCLKSASWIFSVLAWYRLRAIALPAQPARNPDYRPSENPLLARSRLTGLRTFFSQALLAPKKVPPPSAHSRYEQPEYPQFRQIKQPSAISIVLPHSGQVTVLTSPVGLYSSSLSS